MPKIVEDVTYLNTREVQSLFGASKKRFYDNIKPYLQVYQFDALKTPWYKERDVLSLKNGKLPRMGNIAITGMYRNWTQDLRSIGYRVASINRSIETTLLPDDAVETFQLPATKEFVRKSRMTFVDSTPICAWDTYYPLEFVQGDILAEIKQGLDVDVVERIKEKHGIIIEVAKDKYSARTATLEEQQLLQLRSNEPVLILQRVSYTKDKQVLVLYSDMVLLGSWFAPEHEYAVSHWSL